MARGSRDHLTAFGALAIIIALAVIVINLVFGQFVVFISILIGTWMYSDASKKRFKKDDTAWLFAFSILNGLIGLIFYALTRPKKGEKPVMRWPWWIAITIILFGIGYVVGYTSVSGLVTMGQVVLK